VFGQTDIVEPIHWAYGAYFGTGAYRLGDGEEAYIISVRPRWQLRDAALDEQGRRQVGVLLRFPVAIGAYDFDASPLGQTLGLDNVSTLSAVPGVEIDIPMNPRWSLKPLAYVGWDRARWRRVRMDVLGRNQEPRAISRRSHGVGRS
jgi:hypothetical protein